MLRNHALPRPRPCRPGRTLRSFPGQRARQSGTSLIEFSIVAVPVLLLGMGSIEVSQWFFKRQALSLALLEAGRAAITAHARPAAIETAFEKALLPLFPDESEHNSGQRLHNALAKRRLVTDAAPWRIEILSPSPQAFIDFSDPALAIAQETGLRAINNNYLAEQAQQAAPGWTPAAGPQSELNILQANTLVLRLTYLHEPVLPGIKGLVRLLGSQKGSYGRNAMARGGYIPVVSQLALVMQSHPVDWPSLPNGKVVKEQRSPAGVPVAATNCQGLWCMDGLQTPASGAIPKPGTGSDPALPQWPPTAGPNPADGQAIGTAPGTPPDSGPVIVQPPGLDVEPDDPACGVTLCCAA